MTDENERTGTLPPAPMTKSIASEMCSKAYGERLFSSVQSAFIKNGTQDFFADHTCDEKNPDTLVICAWYTEQNR